MKAQFWAFIISVCCFIYLFLYYLFSLLGFIMKTVIASFLVILFLNGCGVARVITHPLGTASNTAGTIISSGFIAAYPNQDSDYIQ